MNNGMIPKIAFFDFTSCEGCQLTVIDTLQTYPELLDVVQIVEFREAMSDQSDTFDIAFVEGSCTRPRDEGRLHNIRRRAGQVIALGACAHLGGVNAIRSKLNLDEVRRYVYGSKADWFDTYRPRAISEVIDIDGVVPGCPIDSYEFQNVVTTLIQGRKVNTPDYPVCIECKLDENICVYQQGKICLGPITCAGCKAICPSYGVGCDGCRGLIPSPKIDSLREVMKEHGLSSTEIELKLSLFLNNQISEHSSEVDPHA